MGIETPIGTIATVTVKPEWVRAGDVRKIFGISRSHIYELIKDNEVSSTVIRKRGNKTGIRLISYDSIAAWIKKHAEPEAVELAA